MRAHILTDARTHTHSKDKWDGELRVSETEVCLESNVINKYGIQRNTTHLDKPESYRKCYRCRNQNRQSRHWRRPGCHSSEIVTWCPLHTSRCRSPRKPRNPSCRQLKDNIKCGNCQSYLHI